METTNERDQQRYIGDSELMIVHDSMHEDPTPGGCKLRGLLKSEHAMRFVPDRLNQAKTEGFALCDRCFYRLEARPGQAMKNI